MILFLIILYNYYMIFKYNKLWIPVFFIVAYSMLPSNFLLLLKTTPFLTASCLFLGFVFHYIKLTYSTTKKPVINTSFLTINADQRFPFGFYFTALLVLQAMPTIVIKTLQKMSTIPSEQMNINVNSFLTFFTNNTPYINTFLIGYFCSLGIYYMHKSLSMRAKR